MVARIIHSRARVARDGRDPRRDCGDRFVGDAGKLLGVLGAAEQLTERAIRCRHLVEMTVDQHIGEAAFLLHALGERFVAVVDVADIDDQIGLERFQRLEIDLGIAASGEPRNFRPRGDLGKQKLARVGRDRFEPSGEQIGRERIDLDAGRRSGRIDALHAIGGDDGAAGSVGNACGETRQRRGQRCRHAAEQRSAIDLHQISSSVCSYQSASSGTDALKPFSVMETRQQSIRSANSAPHGRVLDFYRVKRRIHAFSAGTARALTKIAVDT